MPSSPSKHEGHPKKSAMKKGAAVGNSPSVAVAGTASPVPPSGKTPAGALLSPTKQRKTSKMFKFAIGDHVEVNYNNSDDAPAGHGGGKDIWVHGVVQAIQADSYDILYDDGFVDTEVSHMFIRPEAVKDLTTAGDDIFAQNLTDLGASTTTTITTTISDNAASTPQNADLLKQIEVLQKTIEELRIGGKVKSVPGTNPASAILAKSTPASLTDSEILELDFSTLAPDFLLQAALSCKYLYIDAAEKAKTLGDEKVSWVKKEEQLARSAKLSHKTSEDVIAKLKKEITELSKKGGSKAAAAAASSAADDLEKAAKEQAERDAATDELKSTISELEQRLEFTKSDKKKLEQTQENLSRRCFSLEADVSKLEAERDDMRAKVEEHHALAEQHNAHLLAITKEKEDLTQFKKTSNSEIKTLRKQCDDFKETIATLNSETEELNRKQNEVTVELQSMQAKHGAEAMAKSKMLAYFEVGLRCEVLTLIGENKRTAVQQWTPGRITKRNDNSTFNCFLDDGTSRVELQVSEIRVIMSVGAYLISDRVEVLDNRSGQPLPGKISRCNPDGSYLVYCDNGVVDPRVPADSLRLILSTLTPPQCSEFGVGDAVIVNYQNSSRWYSGAITSVGETTFGVLLDFGESLEIPPAGLRSWVSPQPVQNCSMCHAISRISRQVDDCKKYVKELQAAHEMATEGAGSSSSLENSRLKYLVTNAWAYVLQEEKILRDQVGELQQFFPPDDALMNHEIGLSTKRGNGGKSGGGVSGNSSSPGVPTLTWAQETLSNPISKEKFDKLKREKIEEERRRRMVIEEERRQAEKARRLAEENFAGETIRKAATKNDMATLVPLVERWSGDKVLSQGFDNNISAVWAAAERGNVAALELLLSHGAAHSLPDVYGSTALAEAASNGHEKALSLLVKAGGDINQANQDGCTPLYRAVGNGQKNTVSLLVKAGADINKANRSGRTPVGMAAWTGQTECLELLLAQKADVLKSDNEKWSPIFSASANNHLDCLDLLIRAKGDVTQVNNKLQTPLYIAAKSGWVGVCAKLVEKGCSVNAQDVDGDSALFVASQEGHIEVMKLLVAEGADILLANKNGLTASKIASQSFQAEAVAYLKIVEAEEMERLRREAESAKKELAEVKAKFEGASTGQQPKQQQQQASRGVSGSAKLK